MPNINKPSTGSHQREQLSPTLLLPSRARLNCTAGSGITDSQLLSNHQGQCSKESRLAFLNSTLTQALELADVLELVADVTDDFCDKRDN
jgi:hypothetical protein